jgi:hypothetical protein
MTQVVAPETRTAEHRDQTDPVFGGDFMPTNLDLALSAVIALGLPFACVWLLDLTGGVLAPLYLYYVIACVLIVRWRKGTLDYRRPARWPWALFGVGLVLATLITLNNWGNYPDYGATPLGLGLTVLIWAPLNGFMEQLIWLYPLDAWRNRWRSGRLRWVGFVIGGVLFLALITLIHVVFWVRFLPLTEPHALAWASPVLNTFLALSYAALYYRARSFWPTFVIHTLVDLQLVLLPNYSILPDL